MAGQSSHAGQRESQGLVGGAARHPGGWKGGDRMAPGISPGPGERKIPGLFIAPRGAVPQLANSQLGTQLSTASICRRRPACVRVSHPYSWAGGAGLGRALLARGL